MLHLSTVEPITLGLLKDLMQKKLVFDYQFLNNYNKIININDLIIRNLEFISSGIGKKNDFYLFYLLLKIFKFNELINIYKEKHHYMSDFGIYKNLIYFDEAENEADPIVFDKKITWTKVKNAIKKEIQKL